MGVLSDIIIASPQEASAINAAGGEHPVRWDCLESKGIDTVKLGTLWQILNGRPPDDESTFITDEPLDQASEDGPWVLLVPDELLAALAALNDDKEESVAATWAMTEEFELDGWTIADVEDYLHALVLHARKALKAGKSLLLWVSL